MRRFFDPSLEKDQLKVARQGGSVLVISTSNFGAARGPQPGDEYEQRELWGVNPEGTKLEVESLVTTPFRRMVNETGRFSC